MKTKSRFFVLALSIIFLSAIPGIQFAQFTIEQIMSAPMPSNLVVAPEGNAVAWVFNREGVRNIWVYEPAMDESRQLTSYEDDDGQALGDLEFTPDGDRIYFVRGGAPNRSGEIPNPTSDPQGAERVVNSVSVSRGEVTMVGKGHSPGVSSDGTLLVYESNGDVMSLDLDDEEASPVKAFTIRGGVSNISWNPVPGNQSIAFANSRGDHGYVCVYDFTDETLQIMAPSVDHDRAPCWSPDGTALAFMRVPNAKQVIPFTPRREGHGWSIHIINIDGTGLKTVWESGGGTGSVFRFISAENQLIWSANDHIVFPWEGDGWTHLYSIPSSGGDAECLSPGEGEVQFVAASKDGNHIYFSSGVGDIDRQHICRVMPGSPSSLVQLTEGDGVQWSPRSADGAVYCLGSTGTTPAHPYRLDQLNGLVPLAPEAVPTDFPSDQIVDPEPVIFTSTDGMPIHAQLFKPVDYDPDVEYPVAIFFHGGSRRQMLLGFHHSGYYHNAFALSQYFANHGYLALAVNYRSGIGYGMEFREALEYGANGAS